MKVCFTIFILLGSSGCIGNSNSIGERNNEMGGAMFRSKCKSCHDIHVKLYGPPLGDISDSTTLFIEKYDDLKKLHKEQLTPSQLKNIVDYIQKNKAHVEYRNE